jgi:hypothetical protein
MNWQQNIPASDPSMHGCAKELKAVNCGKAQMLSPLPLPGFFVPRPVVSNRFTIGNSTT